MSTTCSTVLNVTLTTVPSYSSGHLTVGNFNELTYDFHITEMTGTTLVTISRVDLAGNLIQIYGNEMPAASPPISPDGADIGSSWGYSCNRTFGNTIQIDVVVTGGTISGVISLQGKG